MIITWSSLQEHKLLRLAALPLLRSDGGVQQLKERVAKHHIQQQKILGFSMMAEGGASDEYIHFILFALTFAAANRSLLINSL